MTLPIAASKPGQDEEVREGEDKKLVHFLHHESWQSLATQGGELDEVLTVFFVNEVIAAVLFVVVSKLWAHMKPSFLKSSATSEMLGSSISRIYINTH